MTRRALILVFALSRAASAQPTLHLDSHGNGQLDTPAVPWLSTLSMRPATGRLELAIPGPLQVHASPRGLDASARVRTSPDDFWSGCSGSIAVHADYASAKSTGTGEIELQTPPFPGLSVADLDWHGRFTGARHAEGHLAAQLVGPLVEALPLTGLDLHLQRSGELTTLTLSAQGHGLPVGDPGSRWLRGWLDDHGFEVVDVRLDPCDGSSVRVQLTLRNLAENWRAGGYRSLLFFLQRTMGMSVARVGLELTLVNTALRALPTDLNLHAATHEARLDATVDYSIDQLDSLIPGLLAEQAQTVLLLEGDAPDPSSHLLGRTTRSALYDLARAWRELASDPQGDEQMGEAHLHAERGTVRGHLTFTGGHAAFWRAVQRVMPQASIDTCHQTWQATLAKNVWALQAEVRLSGLWSGLFLDPLFQAMDNSPELADVEPALKEVTLRSLELGSGKLRLESSPLTPVFAARAPGLQVVDLEQRSDHLRWTLRGLPSDPQAAAAACARLIGETPLIR